MMSPTDHFEYKAIDLENCSLRLVRLSYGADGPIQCELFDAWLHKTDDILEYETLSYTWGGVDKPYEIEINGKNMSVTENLLLALRYLRYPDRDRILWIDAICIDQNNDKERGHQVGQMASIYKRAEQVVVWLGQATSETDLALRHMHQLEEAAVKHACNNWKASDKRWENLSSTVQPLLDDVRRDSMLRQREGVLSLLSRSWFRRIWIIQEVANARSAKVMCGTESVSARIFAIIPTLMQITPDPHCQAVLEIMPGPLRKHSWWTQKRDLHTLLLRFRKSEATDPRDVIYALLGISSDGCGSDILVPNYTKSLEEVVNDTVAFLLHFRDQETPMPRLPQWKLLEFLQNLDSLASIVFIWAAENGHTAVVSQLLNSEGCDVDSRCRSTALWVAIQKGQDAIAKMMLDTGRVNIDSRNEDGQTPLFWATRNGHESIVKLLLKTGKVDVNSKDRYGEMPLFWATRNGHEAIAKLLLEIGKADVDLKDSYGQTPLFWAACDGQEAIAKLLLETGEVDANLKDNYGQTPLSKAAQNGHKAVAKLLLKTEKADADPKDNNGRTPLSWAVRNGHDAITELLLKTGKVDVNLID